MNHGFFKGKDLEDDERKMLEAFFYESYSFPFLLAYSRTVSDCSDLGDLWYREFYLEITKQVGGHAPHVSTCPTVMVTGSISD